MFEENYFSRIGNWYLALEVTNQNTEDCLKPKHPSRAKAIKYLRALQKEYLDTGNYADAYFRRDR